MGANIREAFYGHGTADFIAKLQIALKECSESEYWLELLMKADITTTEILLISVLRLRSYSYPQ